MADDVVLGSAVINVELDYTAVQKSFGALQTWFAKKKIGLNFDREWVGKQLDDVKRRVEALKLSTNLGINAGDIGAGLKTAAAGFGTVLAASIGSAVAATKLAVPNIVLPSAPVQQQPVQQKLVQQQPTLKKEEQTKVPKKNTISELDKSIERASRATRELVNAIANASKAYADVLRGPKPGEPGKESEPVKYGKAVPVDKTVGGEQARLKGLQPAIGAYSKAMNGPELFNVPEIDQKQLDFLNEFTDAVIRVYVETGRMGVAAAKAAYASADAFANLGRQIGGKVLSHLKSLANSFLRVGAIAVKALMPIVHTLYAVGQAMYKVGQAMYKVGKIVYGVAASVVGGIASLSSKIGDVFQSISQSLQSTGKSMQSWGKTLSLYGGAVTGALTAASKSFATYGSEALKVSRYTGVAVDQLTRLGYAAGLNEVSFETLSKGLKRMNVNLSFAKGTSEAKNINEELARVGLNLSTISGLTPEEQLYTLADVFSKVQDSGVKAGVATKIFGREAGPELLGLLSLGREGIKTLADEADRLGVTLSGPQAAAADALGDAFDRVIAAGKGLKNAVGTALADTMGKFLTQVTNAVTMLTEWVKTNPDIVTGALKLAGVITGVGTAMYGVGKAVEWLGILLSPAGLVLGAVVGLVAMTGALDDMMSKVKELVLGFEIAGKSVGQWLTEAQPLFDALSKDLQQLGVDLKNAFSQVGSDLVPVFTNVIAVLKALFNELAVYVGQSLANELRFAVEDAKSLLSNPASLLQPSLKGTKEAEAATAARIARERSFTGNVATEAASQETARALKNFSEYLPTAGNAFKEGASNIKQALANFGRGEGVSMASNIVTPVFDELVQKLNEPFANIAQAVRTEEETRQPLEKTNVKLNEGVIGTFSAIAASRLSGGDTMTQLARQQLSVLEVIAGNTRKFAEPTLQ